MEGVFSSVSWLSVWLWQDISKQYEPILTKLIKVMCQCQGRIVARSRCFVDSGSSRGVLYHLGDGKNGRMLSVLSIKCRINYIISAIRSDSLFAGMDI